MFAIDFNTAPVCSLEGPKKSEPLNLETQSEAAFGSESGLLSEQR